MKMSNKAYDTLKEWAAIWIPMIAAVVIGIGEVWGIECMAPIGATITLIDGALGVALDKLSKDYHKEVNDNE